MNDKDIVSICILGFIYLVCLIELTRILYPKLRTWYIRWSVLRKTRLKTVDLHKATEKDVQELGRVVGPYISNDHKEPKPYFIEKDSNSGAYKTTFNESNYVPHSSVMKTLRNKKTGVVIICPWSLDKIKANYGDNWEIVEAAIKG